MGLLASTVNKIPICKLKFNLTLIFWHIVYWQVRQVQTSQEEGIVKILVMHAPTSANSYCIITPPHVQDIH